MHTLPVRYLLDEEILVVLPEQQLDCQLLADLLTHADGLDDFLKTNLLVLLVHLARRPSAGEVS